MSSLFREGDQQWPEEGVPIGGEQQHRCRDDRRPRQGQRDYKEEAEPAGSIHSGRGRRKVREVRLSDNRAGLFN